MKKGVGAGPGDPDLITVMATKCHAEADVILYDRLYNRELFYAVNLKLNTFIAVKRLVNIVSLKRRFINCLLVNQ